MKRKIVYLLLLFGVIIGFSAKAQIPANPITEEEQTDEHQPGSGFLLVNKKDGTFVFSPYATVRYLNQSGFDDSYTDAFGKSHDIRKRNDMQFQKVSLYFKGWLLDPKFRYLLYTWTANTNQGLGAQVVVGGNLQYQIDKHFDIGAGIAPLPTSRSLFGQWPSWLRQDARPMAEEYFRGSFTTGFWVQGEITDGLYYKTMLGNNLSQLGVDAGQMDSGFDTWSTALWWTTNNFGRLASFGDYEKHNQIATILGAAFTRSNETKQSQPNAEAPENSQIRISDGTNIFNLNAFGEGTQVTEAKYQMTSINGGIKYQGFSLDLEYYMRWISDFKTVGTIPVSELFDKGFSLQASGMLLDKKLQLYAIGSYIDGEYGNPWEINGGLNWYPFKSRVFRINPEVMYSRHSPVGYSSYPTVVGANGTGFMVNMELFY